MNWWTEELPPTQALKYMIVLGALNGALLVLVIPRFTTVGEVLGVIAAMASTPLIVLVNRRLESFRSTRLKFFLGFAFVCIVFGAFGYVYNM
jgi:hypothetical protein